MSKLVEDMIMENKRKIAVSMIKDGILCLKKIAIYVGLTLEEVKQVTCTNVKEIEAEYSTEYFAFRYD